MSEFGNVPQRRLDDGPDYRNLHEVAIFLRDKLVKLESILLQSNLQEISDVANQLRRTISVITTLHPFSDAEFEHFYKAAEYLGYVENPLSSIDVTEGEVIDPDRQTVWAYNFLFQAVDSLSQALPEIGTPTIDR